MIRGAHAPRVQPTTPSSAARVAGEDPIALVPASALEGFGGGAEPDTRGACAPPETNFKHCDCARHKLKLELQRPAERSYGKSTTR